MLYKPSGAEQEPLKALAPQSVGAAANGDQHHNSKGTFQAEAAPARRDQAAGSAPGQQLSARGSDLQGGAGTGLLAGASVAGALALLLVVAAALNLLRRRSCRSAEHARPNSAEHAKPALGFPDAFLPPAAQDSIQAQCVATADATASGRAHAPLPLESAPPLAPPVHAQPTPLPPPQPQWLQLPLSLRAPPAPRACTRWHLHTDPNCQVQVVPLVLTIL